jgi:beta-glucosidase
VASLDLPGVQEELVHAVAATGTPVVLVLVAGRPIGSPSVHAAASAVLMAWLPGERGGPAIADALVGAAGPGGKLPVTYPRSSGQIPIFYAHKVSGGRSHWKGAYVDLSNEPLYPFGHGLAYTSFSIEPEVVEGRALSIGDTVDAADKVEVVDVVEVATLVTNTGPRAGDEVVQLYATDAVASVTRPVRELVGFARVHLAPGASVRVVFELRAGALGFTGADLRHIVEPGPIDLALGSSSADTIPCGSVDITGAGPRSLDRVFTTPVRIEPC